VAADQRLAIVPPPAGARPSTAGCQVHKSHRPEPLLLHVHHIQPRGMGGADVAGNRVTVCPTGHFNIHTALAALVYDKPVPKAMTEELHYARLGFHMWDLAGKPGNPHASYG
jgi:hypothetical protein